MTAPSKDWVSPKIEIRETAENGKGMFAAEKVKTGDPLIVFGREYTDSEGTKGARADENYISKWECKCDSPMCRKKVTGKDWRLPELQERYKNHFSPLINKRIKAIKNVS